MKRFSSNDPGKAEPIRIEQVFAEKPNGGVVKEPGFDAPATTAVYKDGEQFKVIKGYRLVQAVGASDTNIKIAKGSGIVKGEFLGYGKKAVAAGNITTTDPDYDQVTVTMGIEIPKGAVLYQAKAASADAAEPIGVPVYVTGNDLTGGIGDQPVRLINGANLREVTANIGKDIAAMIPTINLV